MYIDDQHVELTQTLWLLLPNYTLTYPKGRVHSSSRDWNLCDATAKSELSSLDPEYLQKAGVAGGGESQELNGKALTCGCIQ